MNKVVMMGRLVGDPKISYSKNGNAMAIARYRLAVARKSKKQGEAAADFFSCVVFGKSAEFAERYLHKGTQICISGRLQTGSYVNNENQKVTTTEIVVEDTSFAGPKQENTMPGNVMPNNQGYGAYAQQLFQEDEATALVMENISYDDREIPLEYTISYINGELYSLNYYVT